MSLTFVLTFTTTTLMSFRLISFSQTDQVKLIIDSLRYSSEVPYACYQLENEASKKNNTFTYNNGCGDRFLWNAIRLKKRAIPYLIDKLDDTTATLASFPLQGGQCTVGKMAYIALQEIIEGIPTPTLLGVNPKDYNCGDCYYHIQLQTEANRLKFKKAVSKWYYQNRNNLVWVKANYLVTCDSDLRHPNGGHYKIKKKQRQSK